MVYRQRWFTVAAARFRILAGASLLMVCAVQPTLATPIDAPLGYKLSICESLDVLKHPNDMDAAMMAVWTTPAQLAMQRNQPYLCLENSQFIDGTGTAALTSFTMTIGDTSQNFDWARIIELPAGVTATVITPDTLDNNAHANKIQIDFTGFTPGKKVYFQVDIDPDDGVNLFGDYRAILFTLNGGPNTSGNSKHKATFVDPSLPPGMQTVTTPYEFWPNPTFAYPTTIGLGFRSAYMQDHVQPFCTSNMEIVPEPSTLALACLAGVGLALVGRGCRSRRIAA